MDIVEWLRELKMSSGNADWNATIVNNRLNEAADEIERLRDRLYLYDCWCQVKNVIPATEDLNEMARIYWPRALKEKE